MQCSLKLTTSMVRAARTREDRAQAERSARSPWILDSCKLTEDDIAIMELIWREGGFSRRRVDGLRKQSCVAPQPPDRQEKLLYAAHVVPNVSWSPGLAWLGEVCWQRQYFSMVGLVLQPEADGERAQHFAFLHAYQKPYFMQVVKLAHRP